MARTTRAIIKSKFSNASKPTGSDHADAVDTYLDGPKVDYVTKRVDPAAGGDYTTIGAALAGVFGLANESLRYRIMIEPGTYQLAAGDLGLVALDYVDWYGAPGVIVRSGTGATASALLQGANCRIANIKFVAQATAEYAAHIDGSAQNGLILDTCSFVHENANHQVVGCGGRPNCFVTLKNCDIQGLIGIHGVSTSRVLGGAWGFTLHGVSVRQLILNDFLEYERNLVSLAGCKIEQIQFSAQSTYYDANPGDPLYNQTYYNESILIEETGFNQLGNLAVVGNVVRTVPQFLASVHETVLNNDSGTIAAGELTKIDDGGTYAGAPIGVKKYNGSGIPSGYAVADMAAGALGVVQQRGRPNAYVDASGSAISLYDGLEANSSGHLVKLASGRLIAYARAAKASGTGLIEVQMA